jgi:hypothetical protein
MDLGVVELGGVDCIGLVRDRGRYRAFVNSVMNLRLLGNAGKLSSGFTTSGFPNSVKLH